MLTPTLHALLLPFFVPAACCAACSWVRSIAFDPSNEWFVTGSADRTIKLWDTGSGQLKLTLTGHIEQVTGLAVSPRHPYMFSASLDKEVKCWDLEHNKVRPGGGRRG
jgi:pleiotropic regulator 1